MGTILSVNLAVPELSTAKDGGVTGINKRPAPGPVYVRPPGPKTTGLGSGVVGDQVFAVKHHGGDEQAVYAYAREDLDWWEAELGRDLPGGLFGENLTTVGVDVNGALIGQRWQIGERVVLEVRSPRIPCVTFAAKMDVRGWINRFTSAARPGAYLRVVEAGHIAAGDPVRVVHRPAHDVSVEVLFRALTLEPGLLPRVAEIDELSSGTRRKVLNRLNQQPSV